MLTKDEAISLRDNLVNKIFHRNGWTGDVILQVINDFVEKDCELINKINLIENLSDEWHITPRIMPKELVCKINEIIKNVNLISMCGDNNNE